MRGSTPALAAALVSALVHTGAPGAARLAAADFTLGFEGCPDRLTGPAGSRVELDLLATLTTRNNDFFDAGAQGWSISIASEGGLIEEITVDGIMVSTIYFPTKHSMVNKVQDLALAGFVLAELEGASVGPQPGAVSAIVLNQQRKQVLQPNGTAQIARLKVEGAIPDQGASTLRVSYKNGLAGSGETVNNVVTFNNKSVNPTFEPCSVPLAAQEGEFNLALVPEGRRTHPAGDNEVIARHAGVPGGGGPSDALVPVNAILTTAGLPPGDGPQGWSLGIAHQEPCMAVSEVTVDGVVVSTIFQKAKPPEPPIELLLDLGDAGFIVAETTSRASPRPGVVTATVLNQQRKQVLRANATDPLLKVVYRVPVSPLQTTDCVAEIVDGLVGSGEPVDNVITLNNRSKTPTRKQGLVVNLTGIIIDPFMFRRGDPSDDGRLDLGDAIWIVQEVALDGPSTPCIDAGDVNDDERYNIADAVYIIQYQFMAGPPPRPPFPNCGIDDDTDEAKCPQGSARCFPGG